MISSLKTADSDCGSVFEEQEMALIEIAPMTTMEEVLRAYPSATVALFQNYHIGGWDSCGYQPTQTVEEVRRDFNIQDGVDKIASVIYASAEVFASLHISRGELASALWAKERRTLLDVRKPAEYDAENLPGSRLGTVELTFEILDTWPKDTLIVCYSRHGRRSLDQASYFRAYSFRCARRLSGGRDAWAVEVGHEAFPAAAKG